MSWDEAAARARLEKWERDFPLLLFLLDVSILPDIRAAFAEIDRLREKARIDWSDYAKQIVERAEVIANLRAQLAEFARRAKEIRDAPVGGAIWRNNTWRFLVRDLAALAPEESSDATRDHD